MPAAHRVSNFRQSFRYKLLLIFTQLTAFVSFFFGTLYVVSEIHTSRNHLTEQLRMQAESLGEAVRLSLYAGDRDACGRVFANVRA